MSLITNIIILFTAIPLGYFLAWLTVEELKPGHKWFKMMLGVLIVLFVIGYFIGWGESVLWTLGYFLIVVFVSMRK